MLFYILAFLYVYLYPDPDSDPDPGGKKLHESHRKCQTKLTWQNKIYFRVFFSFGFIKKFLTKTVFLFLMVWAHFGCIYGDVVPPGSESRRFPIMQINADQDPHHWTGAGSTKHTCYPHLYCGVLFTVYVTKMS